MQEDIKQSLVLIKQGKLLLCPTDTIYGIGCDATSIKAVKKIYKIKQRSESKSLIVLVNSLEMLKYYVERVPKDILEYLKINTEPTTVIYNNPINLAKNVISKDNTIAIRIVNNGFVYKLIKAFGKPIVSTSANVSGKPTPTNFKDIDKTILEKVDYVVNLPNQSNSNKSSVIIKLVDGKIEFLRK